MDIDPWPTMLKTRGCTAVTRIPSPFSLNSEFGLDEHTQVPTSISTPRAAYDQFQALLGQIVSQRQMTRSQTEDRLRAEMLKYVDEHFTESILSLKLLSDKFSMTEKCFTFFQGTKRAA